MNKEKLNQEQLCLNCKILIDYLRSNLYLIDDFPDFHYWDNRLKKLKYQIDGKYWSV